ncbi:MAG: AraC family transcriptional regulator [Bacteroidaceae bacterium]|nr:AraC family transcriptional regulator [Bacteroidaceae bacterium]
MAKYNYHEKKEKTAAYRTEVSPVVIDGIYEQILRKMIVEKKFLDPTYTAKRLAEDLNTNTRYISATVNLRFQMNFSELVSSFRVREAIGMMTDRRLLDLTMGEIAEACGFANRQSFYAAFFRMQGKTPLQYKKDFLKKLEDAKKKKAEKRQQKKQ